MGCVLYACVFTIVLGFDFYSFRRTFSLTLSENYNKNAEGGPLLAPISSRFSAMVTSPIKYIRVSMSIDNKVLLKP